MSRVPRFHVTPIPQTGTVRMEGDEGRHLVRVLRARPGDGLRLFDGAGREVECAVVSVDRDGALVEILRAAAPPRPLREVVLVTSIPRGERMEWLIEKAVEAGVSLILPVATDRSVRKEASPNVQRRWARSALEAAKQCGRADIPEIAEPSELAEAVVRAGSVPLLVATPGAARRLADLVAGERRVALFIGPEGGFGPEEEGQLLAAGARPFGLGPLVLRVETAAIVAVHAAAS